MKKQNNLGRPPGKKYKSFTASVTYEQHKLLASNPGEGSHIVRRALEAQGVNERLLEALKQMRKANSWRSHSLSENEIEANALADAAIAEFELQTKI